MDFKTRIKNEIFWVTLIPTGLLLIQQILNIFGITFDYTNVSQQLIGIIGTVFALLALLGVAVNPLTKGIRDDSVEELSDLDQLFSEIYDTDRSDKDE